MSVSLPREPVVIGNWVLIIYATAVFAVLLSSADALDVLLWDVPVLLWIVSPAAFARLMAGRAKATVEAWLFVGAETTLIASTACLCAMLFINTGSNNAQSGMALLMLPLLQFAGLSVYMLIVFVSSLFFWRTGFLNSFRRA